MERTIMTGDLRRQHILNDINQSSVPLSASKIAKKYNVSRQIIVGDVALLRASGHDIMSTARGYIISKHEGVIHQIAVSHTPQETEKELRIIINHGGIVLDVTVEHPVYGQITGMLNIKNEDDIQDFLKRVSQNDTGLLLTLTHGLHLHKIECKNEATFEEIKSSLNNAGFLYHND